MKFYRFKSKKQANVRVLDYLIDWDHVVSGPQKRVKEFLYPYWKGCIVLEEFCIPGSRLRCDLMNLNDRVIVEVSPASSHSYNRWFHKNRYKYGAAVQRDLDKEEWAEANGFRYISLDDDDIAQLSPRFLLEEFGLTL